MQRTILHAAGDAFCASVERVFDPRLNGKPVIVGGSSRGRHLVISASYEAQKRGVQAAMPVAKARRLCPGAMWVQADSKRYTTAAQMFLQILEQYSPCIESESMGVAYVDMTGCRRLHGHPVTMARKLQQQIFESMKLCVSIGIAATKLGARLASGLAKPHGILYIIPDQETAFLSPMPVYALPGLNRKVQRRLLELGIRSLGDFGRLRLECLHSILGDKAMTYRCQALGLDSSPVDSGSPQSIHRETTFDVEVIDRELIKQALGELVARNCRRCRQLELKARKVAVQIVYTDLQKVSRSQILEPATDLDLVVLNSAQQLMRHLYRRRAAVRMLGVALSDLFRDRMRDLPFASNEGPVTRRLYEGLDAIRDRFGFNSVAIGQVRPCGKSQSLNVG